MKLGIASQSERTVATQGYQERAVPLRGFGPCDGSERVGRRQSAALRRRRRDRKGGVHGAQRPAHHRSLPAAHVVRGGNRSGASLRSRVSQLGCVTGIHERIRRKSMKINE